MRATAEIISNLVACSNIAIKMVQSKSEETRVRVQLSLVRDCAVGTTGARAIVAACTCCGVDLASVKNAQLANSRPGKFGILAQIDGHNKAGPGIVETIVLGDQQYTTAAQREQQNAAISPSKRLTDKQTAISLSVTRGPHDSIRGS